MIRPLIAAFYAWLPCSFYSIAGLGFRDRFITLGRLLRVHSEVKKIIHWMPEILFAAKIALRGLNRCVPE